MLVEQKNSVADWVEFLGKEHMPALAETVQKLSKLTTEDDSRVSQLTEQILKDPSLTSRVLQISNSVVYKGLGGNIKTITRAIVMLGFTTIRDVSLSMQILDNILKQNPSEHLMTQIANSFHAAMQARGLLRSAKTPDQEEIF
ncbi:MAG TPA: histidine kinase, partial [Gammaproteobacteria bacterium]|nr:histidine kinase [Gammaproteobacteria bacterium]